MVCRIQKVGEHCLKLVVIKLCHRILQGIFNLHVGGGEETEHSQILIYFYPLQFSKIQFIWEAGSSLWLNNFTGYQCFQRHRISWASSLWLPKSLQLYLLLGYVMCWSVQLLQQHLCFALLCFSFPQDYLTALSSVQMGLATFQTKQTS